jgi:hypothetical protein
MRVRNPDCSSLLESTAETQPKIQPALLRLSAITSQFFIRFRAIAHDCAGGFELRIRVRERQATLGLLAQ